GAYRVACAGICIISLFAASRGKGIADAITAVSGRLFPQIFWSNMGEIRNTGGFRRQFVGSGGILNGRLESMPPRHSGEVPLTESSSTCRQESIMNFR